MMAKPPYYKVRKGRGFFELGRERAERAGMDSSIPLGPDSDEARAEGGALYAKWRRIAKEGFEPEDEVPGKYPPGSLGSWFRHYRKTQAWARKAPATRKEWADMWRFIGPALGERQIRAISPGDFNAFYVEIERDYGIKTRWRVVKVSRALFRSAVDFHVLERSPAKAMPNPIPPGRKEIWLASEVSELVTAADRINRQAMRIAIRIGWETLFSPGDVRKLSLAKRKRSRSGAYFVIERGKTGREAYGDISPELDREIDAYVASLPVQVLPGQPFLRTARGHEYLKARFLDDFDRVRREAFGDSERRRFQDLRRSGNVEADLADASPEDRAEILANNLHKDAFLEETYTPKTVAKAREIKKKRALGRELLAKASVNLVASGVGTALKMDYGSNG